MAATQLKNRPAAAARWESRPQGVARFGWVQSTWFLALASAVALWLPLSPLGWSAVGWIAPIGWLMLVRQEKLTGKWPYFVLWMAGFAHWLLVLEGIRQAYWVLYFGWIALAAYLAVYLPVFIGLSRIAVHRLRLPLLAVTPVIWVGLELARGHLITGFSMGLLGHTQVGFVSLIQVADFAGAYAVSFVVMFVAAAIVQAIPWENGRVRFAPLVAAVVLLGAVIGYGQWRLNDAEARKQQTDADPLRVAILQESVDTIFDAPESQPVETFLKYRNLAAKAAQEHADLDLMIWPESMFMAGSPQFLIDPDATVPPEADATPEQFRRYVAERQAEFGEHAKWATYSINGSRQEGQRLRSISHLVGTLTVHFKKGKVHRYNSAVLLSPAGKVQGGYYKMHPVMFGEYIPFGETWPGIYRLTPMPDGLSRGKSAEVFRVGQYKLAPSICFESTVPHLIGGHVRELVRRGESPDMLVNVTNDGWFWGTGILDLHYNCAVFRAVENRKPMLVAANTGISLVADGNGRVLARGPRRGVDVLVADVLPDGRTSWYSRIGDWPAGVCLGLCVVIAAAGLRRKRST